MRRMVLPAAVLLLLAVPALAQNEVALHDATSEFFLRFSGIPSQVVLQRLPGDQVGCATSIASMTTIALDNDAFPPTGETISLQIHLDGGGLAGPAFAPFIASGPIVFGPGGAFIFSFDFTGGAGCPAGGVPLPPPYPGAAVPTNDLYAAVDMDAAGVSSAQVFVLSSFTSGAAIGEQPNLATLSAYDPTTAPAPGGCRGLIWILDKVGGGTFFTCVSGQTLAWWMRPGFCDDVLQPYAFNAGRFTGPAGVSGLNPNYGYAGLWPDPSLGDAVGVRLGSSLPASGTTAAQLFLSPFGTAGPFPIFGFTGSFCLAGPTFKLKPLFLGPLGSFPASHPGDDTTGTGPFSTSEAVFGPFPVPGGLPPGLRVFCQALSFDLATFPGPPLQFSTVATIALP